MQVKLDMHVRERVQKKKQLPPTKFPWTVVASLNTKKAFQLMNRILNKWSECHQACTVPLQEQGIFDQMTVFLTIVAGKGGGGNHHRSTNDGI